MQAMDTELWSRLASMHSQIYSHLFAPIWAPIWVILEEEKAATVKSACSKLLWSHLVVKSRKQSALGRMEGAVRGSTLPNTFVRSGDFGVWLSGGKWGCPVSGCTAKESFRVALLLACHLGHCMRAVNFLTFYPELRSWPHSPILRSLYYRTPVNWHILHGGR